MRITCLGVVVQTSHGLMLVDKGLWEMTASRAEQLEPGLEAEMMELWIATIPLT